MQQQQQQVQPQQQDEITTMEAPPPPVSGGNGNGGDGGGVVMYEKENDDDNSVLLLQQQQQKKKMLQEEEERQFYRELAKLPAARTAAYRQAAQIAPDLVRTESPVGRFLRFCSGNAADAADRFAFYWESRKSIYGERAAFLPLRQAEDDGCRHDIGGGNGGSNGPAASALSDEDLSFLKTAGSAAAACFAFLPNDPDGCPVLYTELSEDCCSSASQQTVLRAAFYVWSVLSENERSQDEGYVSVVGLSAAAFDGTFKAAEEMASTAVPVRAKRTYFCCCPAQRIRNTFFRQTLPAALLALEQLTEKREVIFVEDTASELATKMVDCGFSAGGLPAAVGGTATVQEISSAWKERRVKHEMRLYKPKAAVATAAGRSLTDEKKKRSDDDNDDDDDDDDDDSSKDDIVARLGSTTLDKSSS